VQKKKYRDPFFNAASNNKSPMFILRTTFSCGEVRMLKGSGDFSPPDPKECPEDCPFVTQSRDPQQCKRPEGCIYGGKDEL